MSVTADIDRCLASSSEKYAGLSLLNVVFHADQNLTPQGAAAGTHNVGSTVFAAKPEISWSKEDVPRATVLMVDLGPGDGRPPPGGMPYPICHSVWMDCVDGCLARGTVVKPYARPGNSNDEPSRYAFFLFKQSADLTFAGEPAADRAKTWAALDFATAGFMDAWGPYLKFDFAKFLSENEGLTPVAGNSVLVQGPKPEGFDYMKLVIRH